MGGECARKRRRARAELRARTSAPPRRRTSMQPRWPSYAASCSAVISYCEPRRRRALRGAPRRRVARPAQPCQPGPRPGGLAHAIARLHVSPASQQRLARLRMAVAGRQVERRRPALQSIRAFEFCLPDKGQAGLEEAPHAWRRHLSRQQAELPRR